MPRLAAQSPDTRLAQATRVQVQTALAEAEKIVTSSGYSGRIKDIKRKEIALLKSRLEDGDLQPGDQVILVVTGEAPLTATFTVAPGRVLPLPGIGDISLKGVLRSEVKDYLTSEFQKYLKSPTVYAQTTMRLSVLGGVGRPGFYQVPSEQLIGDAIMAAGGPAAGADPSNTNIQRNGQEVLTKEGFRQAVIDGRTLDQLNLRAGDEIIVGGHRTPVGSGGGGTFLRSVLPLLGAATSVGYLLSRIL
jgi:hypothetical protein